MHKYLPFLCIVFFASQTTAQSSYDIDALRYSQYDVYGTARSIGVGGAFSTLGADFGSIPSNPAGLGLFRNSEVVFSPGYINSSTETEFITDPQTTGEFNTSSAGRLYLNNLGAVFARPKPKNPGKLKGYSFAIGYMRMNHFNNKFKFKNQNGFSSLMNAYINGVNGLPASSINFDNVFPEAVLAYNTNLVQEFDTFGTYITPIQLPVTQDGLWRETGSTSLGFLSIAVNVDEKFFFGGSVNFPFVRYERTYDYIESDDLNTSIAFESFEFNQYYRSEGNGFNAQFGFIIKPTSFMRFGASIKTPSYFTFSETSELTMESNFDTIRFEDQYVQSFDNYEVRLPWRMNTGISFIIKKSGFVSFDYELVDHSSSTYDFGPVNESFNNSLNASIDSNYRITSNFRVGAEYAYKSFRLRGGFAMALSPFSFDLPDELDYSRLHFTAGAGYRHKVFSIDIAYVFTKQREFYVPYFLEAGVFPLSVNEVKKNNIVVSASYRFNN